VEGLFGDRRKISVCGSLGSACVSGGLNLELKSDFTLEMSPETTEHHVKQLRDIKVNAELDLSMFDR
jgi:hypothetical protein